MVKQLECYTKKKKDGGKYTTCVEGQKKKKRTRRTKAQMKASKAMGMEDKPAPKVKAKPKAKAKATKKMSAGKSVLFTSGLMAKIGKARKGLIRNYTAKQIKDIVDNNILKLYQAKVLTENTIGENLEAILEDSMANEAENSYWGDDEKISTKSGRMDWYDAIAIPSMKTGNAFKVMYPLLIGWLSMDKYKNDNEVLEAMAKLIEQLLTDIGHPTISNTTTLLHKNDLALKDFLRPFYYPDSSDRRIGRDKWDSFMEGQYTRYVKKIKIPKKKLALGRLFRGIIEGRKFNIAGSNVGKLVKIDLSEEWGSNMLIYTPRMVKGKSVMGLGKDAIKLKTLTDYLESVYK